MLSQVHRGDSHKPVSRIVAGRLLCGANQIPKYSLMRHGMPAQAARQIIMDDLQLDGRPAQNLASFVTTWMEDEAKDILVQTCATNIADQEEYPVRSAGKRIHSYAYQGDDVCHHTHTRFLSLFARM